MVGVLGCLNYYYFDFPFFSFHLEGYSDCLLSTSWRKRTTHLIQVGTHLFSSVWDAAVHSSPGFWYAGYISSNRSAGTVGSVRLTFFLVVLCLTQTGNQ